MYECTGTHLLQGVKLFYPTCVVRHVSPGTSFKF
jgi:hypothetical protein